MKPLLIILGPTASGKTHLATRTAARLNGEIISADSRQVYKNMDIGTGKDLNEYVVNGREISYHLIDIKEAGEQYNVNEFQNDFLKVCREIDASNRVPVMCGGTGFYMYALLKGHAFSSVPVNHALRTQLEVLETDALHKRFEKLDTTYRSLADTTTRKRLIRAIEISEFLIGNPESGEVAFSRSSHFESVIYGLNPPVELRRERISTRLAYRLKNGMIEEVETLLKSGLAAEQLIYYGLEYKFVTLYLLGQMNYQEMYQRLESEIHRFAKRQMTFFRKMEKDGIEINWLNDKLSAEEQMEQIEKEYTLLATKNEH